MAVDVLAKNELKHEPFYREPGLEGVRHCDGNFVDWFGFEDGENYLDCESGEILERGVTME
jgi:hypothetical protein